MAYRMRIRRRSSTRRSGLARRYFKPQNFKRLQRIARSGRFVAYQNTIDTIEGASSRSAKSAGLIAQVRNSDIESAVSGNVSDPGTCVTMRKMRYDCALYFSHASGTAFSSHVRVGVGIFKLQVEGLSTDTPKSRAYFPGVYMPGRNRANTGFQWLKRAEFMNPVTVKAPNAGRPDPVVPFTWSLYNIRMKPNSYVGLGFWFIRDHGVEIQRCSLSVLARYEAVADAPGVGSKSVDEDNVSDILTFPPDQTGLSYNISAAERWQPLQTSR